jgi:hypothetical protein
MNLHSSGHDGKMTKTGCKFGYCKIISDKKALKKFANEITVH